MDGSGSAPRIDRQAILDRPVGDCVLLADDDPVVRLLTAAALGERGWRVIEVDSGAAALECYQRVRPDVIVLDALMPGLDGFATCERLRRLPGAAHVPILMVTGLDDDASIAEAYEAGATDFFVKSNCQWTLLSERLRYMIRAARTRDELAASEDRIRQLANYDSLTGLPNRRFFREQFAAGIDRAGTECGQLALLFIDIDRFKQINDTLGHEVGDQLLREIALRLQTAVDRVASTLASIHAPAASAARGCVARLGGDEFTVMLPGVNAEDADRAVRTLIEGLERPFNCAGNELFATVSVGVALFPRDGADVDTLVRKADIAMYAAKDQGRNGWLSFDESMNKASADRWRLESALHRALERHELLLFYQPKLDAASGRIIGAEALMRWWREGRLVPPLEFIAAAEESGLIVPITEWAILEACSQLDDWSRCGASDVTVAVNISSRHVQRGKLDQSVQAALARYPRARGMLELELTETVLMHNLDAAQRLLQQLKQLGVSISIDDFGTGYSSLAYLSRLPIDTLKIDRSFVRELETSPDSQAIVAAVVALSQSLKLRAVAEGVETVGQKTRLLEQGCRYMQGFLFSRPLPAHEFRRLLLDEVAGRVDWRAADGGGPSHG